MTQLEDQAREIGRVIASALPAGKGFTLLLFDFGEGGEMTFISNGNRADVVEALRELIGKLDVH